MKYMGDLENLLAMDAKNGLLFMAALIIIFVFIIQKWDFVVSRFGIKTRRVIEIEKQNSAIEELKEHAARTDESIKGIVETLECLKSSLDGISNQVHCLGNRLDENEAARLKDRIAESYRYYHERQQWTSMEKESLESLIAVYT